MQIFKLLNKTDKLLIELVREVVQIFTIGVQIHTNCTLHTCKKIIMKFCLLK